jgi:hypothetical protein
MAEADRQVCRDACGIDARRETNSEREREKGAGVHRLYERTPSLPQVCFRPFSPPPLLHSFTSKCTLHRISPDHKEKRKGKRLCACIRVCITFSLLTALSLCVCVCACLYSLFARF